MTFPATSIFMRVMLFAAVLCLLTACGNGYRPKEFPTEGKQAFEDYLDQHATKYEDLEGNPTTELPYFIQWAAKGQEVRTNITAAWCIIATNMVWLESGPNLFFLVYQTEDKKWHVSPSDSDNKKAGCTPS